MISTKGHPAVNFCVHVYRKQWDPMVVQWLATKPSFVQSKLSLLGCNTWFWVMVKY